MEAFQVTLQFLMWLTVFAILPVVAACVFEKRMNAATPEGVSARSVGMAWLAALYPLLPFLMMIVLTLSERIILGHWRQDFEKTDSVILSVERFMMAATLFCIPAVAVFGVTFAVRLRRYPYETRLAMFLVGVLTTMACFVSLIIMIPD